MKRDTKQKGKFWLPQTPDHKVDGEFKLVNESEGQLTLSGVIDPNTDRIIYFNEHFKRMHHSLIIGQLNSGEGLALLQSSFRSVSFDDTYCYYIEYTLFTGNLLIGDESDLQFSNISFSFDHLPQYLGTCLIKHEYSDKFESAYCKYSCAEHSFRISDSLDCQFTYTFTSTYSSKLSTAQFSPITLIEYQSSSDIDISEWLRFIDSVIGSLFSILIGEYLCPVKISTHVEFNSNPYRYEVFYRRFNKRKDMVSEKIGCLRKMMPGLEDYIREFMDFSSRYPVLISNYMAILKYDAILEYQYLSAVYSVESFSRYVFNDHYFFSKEEFNCRYNEPLTQYILENLADSDNIDFIHRLQNTIQHSNERSLRSLLRQLFKENQDVISRILDMDVKNDVSKIVVTRNWYTHFPIELEPLAAKGYELYKMYVKVRILFDVLLFKQINMPDDVIIKTVKSTYLLD